MAIKTPVLNVTEFFMGTNGQMLDKTGSAHFKALNNHVNLIMIYLEDGGSLNATTFANFKPEIRSVLPSVDFYCEPKGIFKRIINGESAPRNFYAYALSVPNPVLNYNRTDKDIKCDLTFKQRFNSETLGVFPSLAELEATHPATEELKDDKAVAYVLETLIEGFYVVAYDEGESVYEWVKVTSSQMPHLFQTKQYNIVEITIGAGNVNPQEIIPIETELINIFMTMLHNTQAEVVNIQEEVDKINEDLETLEIKTDEMLDGTVPFTQIQLANGVFIRYLEENGNNYRVVEIEYPDGRRLLVSEEQYVNFTNTTGVESISLEGRCVALTGITLGNQSPNGVLANPTDDAINLKTIGVVTEQNILTNQKGKLTTFGIVHDIPSSAFRLTGFTYEEGQFLWVHENGRLSNVPPAKPAIQHCMGILINITGPHYDVLITQRLIPKIIQLSDVDLSAASAMEKPILIWDNNLVVAHDLKDDLDEKLNLNLDNMADVVEVTTEDFWLQATEIFGISSKEMYIEGSSAYINADHNEYPLDDSPFKGRATIFGSKKVEIIGGNTEDDAVVIHSFGGMVLEAVKSIVATGSSVEIGATSPTGALFLNSLNQIIVNAVSLFRYSSTPAITANGQIPHKLYVDDKVANDITSHDESETAHLFIRQLIEELEKEIERLDGRGRSYGEIPYTTAQFTAFTAQERIDNVKAYVEAQDWFEGDYTASNGDLVYDEGTGNGVAFHEWEFNGTAWVDNGMIGFGKASNSIFGQVKGDGTYVNIVSGLIEVLKSDYADRLGTSGAYLDYTTITNELLNRYTKAEVDFLLDQLKAIYGWEDSELASAVAHEATVNNSIWSGYDWLLLIAKDGTNTYAEPVRVSDLVDGDIFTFGSGTFTVGATTSLFEYVGFTLDIQGYKMTPLDATKVAYDNTDSELLAVNVQEAIDEIGDKKIDKDFTPYDELTTDLNDDDYLVVRDISNNQTKKTKVSTLRQFETNTFEYGVRYIDGQTSSVLERVKIVNGEMTLGSATNLVANVGVDDEVVVNSFDNIDIFIRNRVVIGGNTLVQIPKYYIREYSANEGGTVYNYILMCAKKMTGYRLPIRFDNGDGTEKDYAYIGAYEASIDENGVARSISGALPSHTITRNNSRIAARKNDGDGTNTNSDWGLKDKAEHYDLVQVPIYIEFANLDTQVGIGRGVVDLTFDANTVADSTVANTAIIENNANFEVDMTIYLSTGTYHTITQIDEDTPIAGQMTITFDGATVTPLTGVNLDPRQYKTGFTDSVVASTGFYKVRDGKHPFKWRGMENVWGNVWEFIDGVKISNHYAWVSTNPEHYDDVSSVGGDYGANWTKLSYQNPLENGYIEKLGFDDRFPFARLPLVVGGGSTTFYADYYYQNTGDRTLLVGGLWFSASIAGLTGWLAASTLGSTSNGIGFRLSYRP